MNDSKLKMGWLFFDFSETNKFKEILSQLSTGSIDELGMMVIRNYFRQKLFPGVVRPMTRLRYYFFTYYLIRMAREQPYQFPGKKYFDEQEDKLRKCLLKGEEAQSGIFGTENPDRHAYDDYWRHLHKFAFFEERKTIGEFCNHMQGLIENEVNENDEQIDVNPTDFNPHDSLLGNDDIFGRGIDEGLEEPYQNFKERLKKEEFISFKLHKSEVDFFEKVLNKNHAESLFCYLVNNLPEDEPEIYQEIFISNDSEDSRNDNFWKKIDDLLAEKKDSMALDVDTVRIALRFNRLMGIAYSVYWSIYNNYIEVPEGDMKNDIREEDRETIINYAEQYCSKYKNNITDEELFNSEDLNIKCTQEIFLEKFKRNIQNIDLEELVNLIVFHEKEAKVNPQKCKLKVGGRNKYKKIDKPKEPCWKYYYGWNYSLVRGFIRDLEGGSQDE